MTDLERLRHSCAHVMATAILRLWPDAQFAAGPPVENGFYYDVDLQHRITPEDFPAIEAEMKKEIKANHTFEKVVVTREQAIKDSESGRLGGLSERPGNPSKFKLGNLQDIPDGEPITYFKSGDFIDLCAGPHVMRTGNIGALQAHQRRQRLLQGRREEPAAPAHLWHRLQEQDRAGGLGESAGGSQRTRPPQAGPAAGAVCHRRSCRPGARAVDAQRRDHPPGTAGFHQRATAQARLPDRSLRRTSAGWGCIAPRAISRIIASRSSRRSSITSSWSSSPRKAAPAPS